MQWLWQRWHFEFTTTTTCPNADKALKLNHLRQPALLPALGFASHLNTDRTSHRSHVCHIDLPPRRVKFTKEEQKKRVDEREWETYKSIRWHCQTKRVLADVCAVVQWSMQEVYVGSKEEPQHPKPVREPLSVSITSFKAKVSSDLCHQLSLMCFRWEFCSHIIFVSMQIHFFQHITLYKYRHI